MLAESRSTQFSEWVSAKNDLASLRAGTGDLTGAIEDLNQADTFIRAEAGDVNLERILIKNHLAIVCSQLGDPPRTQGGRRLSELARACRWRR